MKRRIGKYILLSCMLAMTIACLTSTTYAFVILNQSVEVEIFNLEIDSGDGVLISLDGKNFANGITKQQLEAKLGTSFDDIKLAPTTVKHSKAGVDNDTVNGKIKYDSTTNHLIMQKDSIVKYPEGHELHDSDVYGTHEFIDATENKDYVTFDLYFKIVGQYDVSKNYKIALSSDSFLKNTYVDENGSSYRDVILENNLITYDENGHAVTYGPNEKTNEYDRTKISVNPVDAMRMAFYQNVVKDPNRSTNTSRIDATGTDDNEIVIIENSVGLGSAAIEGRNASTDPNNLKYDKTMNAMYTYYNNLYPFTKFTEAAQDGEAFNNNVTLAQDRDLARFVRTYADDTATEANGFAVLKITVTLWLEGWDADYFLNVENGLSKFAVRLKFELQEDQQY